MEADSLSASCPQNVFPGHESSTAMFTKAGIFGTNRTIVLGPQESSVKKLTALRFPSANLATDGSRLFFL